MHRTEKKLPKAQYNSFVNRHEGKSPVMKNDRPEHVLQRTLRELADNSPQSKRFSEFRELADTYTKTPLTAQRNILSKPLAGKQPDEDIEQIIHLLGENEIATAIFEAYAENDQETLNKFPQLIGGLVVTEDLPAEQLANVLTLWAQVSTVIMKKKALRDPSTDTPTDTTTTQESKASEQKVPDQRKLDGLVVNRMPAYLQKVKELVRMLITQSQPTIKTGADVVRALYEISATILLPELAKQKLFPELIVDDSMSNNGLFSRKKWSMSISVDDDPDKLAGLVGGLATAIIHETRHVEQAWIEIWLAVNKTKSREKVDVRLRRITDEVAAAKKIAKVTPSSVNDGGIIEVVKAGQQHKYTRKAAEDHEKVTLSHVTSGLSAAVAPDFASIQNYFLHEQEYYSHPREIDAYAVEREFKRKLVGK